ncbi:hypothetical protein BUALT_Bualt12G0055900 [Buddleja alternifolia]|uniref:F-box associated domain-containing protein n=1 Tax=Buddleja alternifolia TaxID=168488 RepID=A0AAV6WZC6_9LAMI|nr:hypothetical protein BUALT_Bualt12G0055900 [Buddleja alternifolia]
MQYRKLLIDDAEKKTSSGICLVFDPSKSSHYQVICFRQDKNVKWPELGECSQNPSPGVKMNYVMESNGYLHYIAQSLHSDKNYICVYEMNEDDFSWFIKYRVDLNPISATFAVNNWKAISVLGIIRGEKEENSLLLFHVPGKIMFYRFFDEIFDAFVDFTREMYYQKGILQFGAKHLYQFIETLVPV